MTRHSKHRQGFTLIEILIALFIFAIISVVMAAALHNIFTAKGRIEVHENRINQLQIALLLLERDMTQFINLPVNSLYEPANTLSSLQGNTHQLTFVETSFANPEGLEKRSRLQKVRYSLDKKQLTRTTWATLYPATNQAGAAKPLLSDVTELTFDYLSINNIHYTSWPPANATDGTAPQAIILTIKTADIGDITQVYNLYGAQLVIPTMS